MHFAARKGRLEVVQVLLAAGASVEAKNDATGRTWWEGGAIGDMKEMRHDIEFAASFGNFVPGIFSDLYVIPC